MKILEASVTAHLDREVLIARSKALKELAAEHFDGVRPFLSSARIRDHSLQVSRLHLEAWAKDDAEVALIIELAAWTAAKGRSTAVQRYARQRSVPMEAEKAAVLTSMQASVISFWVVQEAHPIVGWIARDVLHEGTLWIVDEDLDGYFDAGTRPNFLTRLFCVEKEGFWRTCGSVVTVPEAWGTFALKQEKDQLRTGSEQHATRSRQRRYVSALYAVIPEAD